MSGTTADTPDTSASMGEAERRPRRALVGAAVLGGIVAISALFALARGDESGADQSDVIDRLFQLGPDSVAGHWMIYWFDVDAARHDAGLEPLPPDPTNDGGDSTLEPAS